MIWLTIITAIVLLQNVQAIDDPIERSIKTVPDSVEGTIQFLYKSLGDSVDAINELTEQFTHDIGQLTQRTLAARLPAIAIERKIRLRSYMYRTAYWIIVNKLNYDIDQRIYNSELHLEELLKNNPNLDLVEGTLVEMNNVTYKWMQLVEDAILEIEDKSRSTFEALVGDIVRKASVGDAYGAKAVLSEAIASFGASVRRDIDQLLKAFLGLNRRLRQLEKVLYADADV